VRGIGLHTGSDAALTFRPAPAGRGVVFRRVDLPGAPEIPALVEFVSAVERRTTLSRGGASVETVEHVLAAVSAHGIDDVTIDLAGPEAPIADGSAAPYFDALRDAGAGVVDDAPSPAAQRVMAPFSVSEGDATYAVSPGAGLRLSVTIEWPHPLIGRQSGSYQVTPEVFGAELAAARTFGFMSELADLRARGLIQGGSAAKAIVLSADGLAAGTLQWPDEFVRHKAMDLVGDLMLLGRRLEAAVTAFRPSHRGNVALVRALKRASQQGGASVYGIQEIMAALPHRYPMLLVDRIVELEKGKRVVGIKNVTINEPFFQGHFPGHPIMPGVLLLEAMGQTGGMLLFETMEQPETKVVYFLGIDKAKFRKPVVPGDQVRFEVEMIQQRGNTVRMKGVGIVDGQTAVEAELLAQIVDR
jgi:UDP-3-O-[3-hydroxymyristoyl] N-acetylglucosamine deacetylase/3-hydroxyacyl-[acyl-carrier-protein] dehydratase